MSPRHTLQQRGWAWLALVAVVFFSTSGTRHFALCDMIHPEKMAAALSACCQPESAADRMTCHSAPTAPASDDGSSPAVPCQCRLETPPLHTTKTTLDVLSGHDPLVTFAAAGFPAQQLRPAGHPLPAPPSPLTHPLNRALRSVVLLM